MSLQYMASILLLILFGKNYTQVWKNKELLVSDSKIFDYPVCTYRRYILTLLPNKEEDIS